MSICLPTDFCFTKVIYKKDESSDTNKSDDEILQPLENVRLALSLDDSSRYEGYVDGHIAGREEGRAEGRNEEKLAIARNLKASGVDISIIATATNLSTDEISKL